MHHFVFVKATLGRHVYYQNMTLCHRESCLQDYSWCDVVFLQQDWFGMIKTSGSVHDGGMA